MYTIFFFIVVVKCVGVASGGSLAAATRVIDGACLWYIHGRDDGRGAGEIKAARHPQQVDAKKEKKNSVSLLSISKSQ